MHVLEFIEKLRDIEKNYKTLYVMGCFGAPLTKSNKTRYTQNHEYNKKTVRTQLINNASEDTFGFDCVNLIKGILWGWLGDMSKSYGGATYKSNQVPDISANQMIQVCSPTTDFSKIQPGWAVWVEGHIGVYIGDGQVIECSPKWMNKVQITALANLGYTKGNSRIWTKCGPLPYLDYSVKEVEKVENKKIYNTLEEIPEYGKEAIKYFTNNGTLNGTSEGLQIDENMLRILVIFYRNIEVK